MLLTTGNVESRETTYENLVVISIAVGVAGSDIPLESAIIKDGRYVVISLASYCPGVICGAQELICKAKKVVLPESAFFDEMYSLLLSAYYNNSPLDFVMNEVVGTQDVTHCVIDVVKFAGTSPF